MVPPPPEIPKLKLLLGEAIKKLYKSKIPPAPKMNVPLPPIPEEAPQIPLTTVDAPEAPKNVVVPPPLNPAIIKRNSIMIP